VSGEPDPQYQVQLRRPGEQAWQAATTWQRCGRSNARQQAQVFADGYPVGGAVRVMMRDAVDATPVEVFLEVKEPVRKCPALDCVWDTRGTGHGAGMPVCWPDTGKLEGCLLGKRQEEAETPETDDAAAVKRVRAYCQEVSAQSMAAVPAESPEEGNPEEAAAEARAVRYFMAQRVLRLLRGPV